MPTLRRLFTLAFLLAAGACGGNNTGLTISDLGGYPDNSGVGAYGVRTSVVAIVNPKYNAGSNTPVAVGTTREGISVAMAATTYATTTDAGGLAVLERVPTGNQILAVAGQSLPLNIVNENELYDVVVTWNNNLALYVVNPIRYPVGHNVKMLAAGSDIASAAAYDGAVILLQAGEYPGNLELRAANVLIFGAWSPAQQPLSKITGDVTVRGSDNRMRGLEITGKLVASANGFTAAFNKFGGAEITGNSATLIRNTFPQDAGVTVSSSNSLLVDNVNIP